MTTQDFIDCAQAVAETVAETGGASETICYIGLQRVGFPHGAEGLEYWHKLTALLVKQGLVTINSNFITPTDKLRGLLKG